ncbi:V-type proton ATPase subunit S1 [Armadillidium nasatum]|uniref:V-type proton ATPase subunit S1 n=1 Tax=Armadillidium nasatum TaxID=96803 RepID=A0A5N5TPX2_9CRUS|nr:V-type proton ATPase subunit S1 [Armadillidium nasatum]
MLLQQDTLSVEDLTSPDVFKHVYKFMENGHSLYVPAMEVGVSLPHSFALHGYNVITIEPGSSIGELKLKKGARNLVVVKLPPTTTNPSREKALQKTEPETLEIKFGGIVEIRRRFLSEKEYQEVLRKTEYWKTRDEIVANVISKIGHLEKFTFIFSGIGTSINLESRNEHHRAVREAGFSSILPARNDPNFHNTGCMLLYLKNDMVVEKANTSYYILNNQTLDDVSDCQTNGFIQVRFKDVNDFSIIRFKLYVRRFYKHWAVKSAELTETTTKGAVTTIPLYAQWPMEYVPLNKSWACAKKLVFLSSNLTSTDETLVKLTINGVQMEAYTHNRTRFSDAWDCVGFFTIPIWMGLFAAMLLTLILIFGMLMLVDIKTMDRFDDPKGKHFMAKGIFKLILNRFDIRIIETMPEKKLNSGSPFPKADLKI